jgi:hypothetical protein
MLYLMFVRLAPWMVLLARSAASILSIVFPQAARSVAKRKIMSWWSRKRRHESGLHGRGQPGGGTSAHVPLAGQGGNDRRSGEPHAHGQHLNQRDKSTLHQRIPHFALF